MFEAYYPNDSRFLKTLQLYGIIGGFYWPTVVFGWIVYLLFPFLMKKNPLRNRKNEKLLHTSGDSYMKIFDNHPHALKIRMELLFTIAFQATLFFVLGVKAWPWFILYMAFGLNWGGLQYADHAYTVRDIRNGAWNLKVNKWIQWVFLNYHHHLAHHQHPHVPWIHLHKFVDFSKPRKSWLEIYLKLWQGAILVKQPEPKAIDRDFEDLIYHGPKENVDYSKGLGECDPDLV